jgi:hypothetical protein
MLTNQTQKKRKPSKHTTLSDSLQSDPSDTKNAILLHTLTIILTIYAMKMQKGHQNRFYFGLI